MEMLKQSTTLAVVGQLDASEATDNLTSITKSYNVAVEDTSKIVDNISFLFILSSPISSKVL